MHEEPRTVVLSAAKLECVELIDAGDTVVVRLKGPDDLRIAVLIPRAVAADLASRLPGAPAASGPLGCRG